jgi:membrane glycosyltransferase
MPTSPPLAPNRTFELWSLVQERVRAYLEATGFEREAAINAASQIIAEAEILHEPGSPEEAAFRLVQRAIAEQVGRAARVEPMDGYAPAAQFLAMPRRTLRSVMDWRLATSMLRRLLPARTPQGVRRHGQVRPPGSVSLSLRAQGRRPMLLLLIALTTLWGVDSFVKILSVDGLSALDLAYSVVFTILFLWQAQSFWTLAAGAGVLAARLIGRRPPITPPYEVAPGTAVPRTAIVVPIYNEDVHRVFAGLEAMWHELMQESEGHRYDLFVLSDTTDPDIWLAELDAWRRLRREMADGERVFYRRRLRNAKLKTGNIEDFITRWGGAYGYMLVLDADSLMTAQAMAELVRRMDAYPEVGLIQTRTKLVRGNSLFARVLQLVGELYGPLLAAGISYWAMGEGNYWGHNAIIRVVPFADLCGLPLLKGRAPLGGEIMSHDFVEAALLRGGGWQVWIADDLAGSYEELPPTIGDLVTRERRWCQGSLQHVRVLMTRNLHWVSRLHLAIGIMVYVTSPLQLLFLLLSAAQAWEVTHKQPVSFTEGLPFPTFPVSVDAEATVLLVVTFGLVFAPKLLGLLLALADGPRRRALGGGLRLTLSVVLETIYSALLTPIMMLFHTAAVLRILLGAAVEWSPQRRTAGGSPLAESVRRFGLVIIGVVAAVGTWWAIPVLFVWLLPVLAGLVLAIPFALVSHNEAVGAWLRRWKLLLTVEEAQPPAVIRRLDALLAQPADERDRFTEAVLDAGFNALHIAMLRATEEIPTVSAPAIRTIERKAVYLGASALDKHERRALLEHPASMVHLHIAAWLHWRGLGRDGVTP